MMDSLVDWSYLDRPALISDSDETLTYRDLSAEITRAKPFISARTLVFILGKNDIPTIVFYLACLEENAVPLLLNSDIDVSALNRLIDLYQPVFIFLPKDNIQALTELKVIFSIKDYLLCSLNKNNTCMELNSDLFLLLATSGSTGSPKLVRFSKNNIISNAHSISDYLNVGCDDRAIVSLPFNYSYGMSIINSHLSVGASVLLTNRNFFDPTFWRMMKSLEVTSLAGVPYSYEMLLKLRFENMSLPALRTLTQAGGKMSLSHTERIVSICQAKGIEFFSMYGQTEASPRMAYLPTARFGNKLGSIGKAIPGGRLWLENDDGEVIRESDQLGELIYSGPNVALGYAHSIVDLSRGDDWNGILRTGDIAKQDSDGFFYIEGRASRYLKLFGNRISLDAVESWYSTRSLVAAAHGQDDHLMVTIEENEHLSISEESKLIAAWMKVHPSAVVISVRPKLPRFDSGKINYSCL